MRCQRQLDLIARIGSTVLRDVNSTCRLQRYSSESGHFLVCVPKSFWKARPFRRPGNCSGRKPLEFCCRPIREKLRDELPSSRFLNSRRFATCTCTGTSSQVASCPGFPMLLSVDSVAPVTPGFSSLYGGFLQICGDESLGFHGITLQCRLLHGWKCLCTRRDHGGLYQDRASIVERCRLI